MRAGKSSRQLLVFVLAGLLASALSCPGSADAQLQLPTARRESRLGGSAALEYVKFDAKGEGIPEVEASSLVQRYSLLYETKGQALVDTMGRFNVALGYEWTSIDSSIKAGSVQNDVTVHNGRPLFNANFYLSPPTMPFSISAYSQDLGRSTINTDEDSILNNGNRLITPGVATSVTNPGTHISSGFSLVIGAKAGARGAVNQYLSQLPGMYVDFSDLYNKESYGVVQQQNHLQKWSVSGKFLDNWLHYRTTEYTDAANALGNYKQTEFHIGLVDKYNRRQWTRLTNWIKVSADGRLTKRSGASSDQNFEEYDLNIFGIATRRTWEASTFFNYNRELTLGSMTTIRRLPLQLKGVMGADTDWSVSFRQEENRTAALNADRSAISSSTSNRTTYAAMKVNTFKRRDFMLSSGLSVEHMTADGGAQTLGAEASAETTSTARFSRNLSTSARLAMRAFQNVQTGQTTYSSDLRVDGRYQQNRTISLSFSDVVSFGKDDAANSFSNIGQAASSAANIGGGTTTVSVAGSTYLRNAASFGVSWTPVAKFRMALTAANSFVTATGQAEQMSTTLTHTLDYTLPKAAVRVSSGYGIQDPGDGTITRTLQSSGLFSYKPQRAIETNARYMIARTTNGAASYRNYELVQSTRYHLFGRTGLNKKMVELYEEFTYSRGEVSGDKNTLLASAVYYPFSRLSLTGRTSYDFLSATTMYGGGIAANFKLMDASADYTYAKRDSDKRVEHRFAAKVQKNF